MSTYAKPIAILQGNGGKVPREWAEDYYGIRLVQAADEFFRRYFRFHGIRPRAWNAATIDRYALESVLQAQNVTSTKFLGIEYGMSQTDMDRVLERLWEESLVERSVLSEATNIVDKDLVRNVFYSLPEIDRKTFGTQTSLKRAIHKLIKTKLGIRVRAVPCVTSVALGESPRELAHHYDIITNRPIGIAHKVWLDFRKPLNLEPDYCSPRTALVAKGMVDLIVGSRPRQHYSREDIGKIKANQDC